MQKIFQKVDVLIKFSFFPPTDGVPERLLPSGPVPAPVSAAALRETQEELLQTGLEEAAHHLEGRPQLCPQPQEGRPQVCC